MTPSNHHVAQDCSLFRRHSGPGGDAADSEAEGHTDLVLLVQSLYTYLRRMPLHDRMGVGIALQFR